MCKLNLAILCNIIFALKIRISYYNQINLLQINFYFFYVDKEVDVQAFMQMTVQTFVILGLLGNAMKAQMIVNHLKPYYDIFIAPVTQQEKRPVSDGGKEANNSINDNMPPEENEDNPYLRLADDALIRLENNVENMEIQAPLEFPVRNRNRSRPGDFCKCSKKEKVIKIILKKIIKFLMKKIYKLFFLVYFRMFLKTCT